MKMILLLTFILILFVANFVSATPSYKLGLTVDKSVVNKDEPVDIGIRASGGGDIQVGKILTYSDRSVLIKPFGWAEYEFNVVFVPLDIEMFKENKELNPLPNNPPLKSEFEKEKVLQSILIKSSKSGDHRVYFILSYTEDNKNWYTDRLEFDFHVNSWLEEEGFFKVSKETNFIVFAIIIALVSLIISAIKSKK